MIGYFVFFLFIHSFRHFLGPKMVESIFFRFNKLKKTQVQIKQPQKKQIQLEKKYIFHSQFIDVFIYFFCVFLIKNNYSNIYFSFFEKELLYSLFSFFFLFILHDFYFYVTHRLMHLNWIYRRIHIDHHKSILTSSYTSFSVHPLEKFIELLFYPLVIFFIPINLSLLGIFIFLSSLINILGHSGFELRKLFHFYDKTPLLNATCIFHILHHRKPSYNFSLYFTYLDKIFNTQFESYNEIYEKGEI